MRYHNVCFTGTRRGMTTAQTNAVALLVPRLFEHLGFGLHGACKGADRQFHYLASPFARFYMFPVLPDQVEWAHQHTEPDNRVELLYANGDTIKRNHGMVMRAGVVLATPSGVIEQMRGSGTWATMRYARKRKVELITVWPDGSVEVS